jgi:hypothetical protein
MVIDGVKCFGITLSNSTLNKVSVTFLEQNIEAEQAEQNVTGQVIGKDLRHVNPGCTYRGWHSFRLVRMMPLVLKTQEDVCLKSLRLSKSMLLFSIEVAFPHSRFQDPCPFFGAPFVLDGGYCAPHKCYCGIFERYPCNVTGHISD